MVSITSGATNEAAVKGCVPAVAPAAAVFTTTSTVRPEPGIAEIGNWMSNDLMLVAVPAALKCDRIVRVFTLAMGTLPG